MATNKGRPGQEEPAPAEPEPVEAAPVVTVLVAVRTPGKAKHKDYTWRLPRVPQVGEYIGGTIGLPTCQVELVVLREHLPPNDDAVVYAVEVSEAHLHARLFALGYRPAP